MIILLMIIGGYYIMNINRCFIMDIRAYSINGYCWLNYHRLLVAILLVVIIL
jgi:hypothetical protein